MNGKKDVEFASGKQKVPAAIAQKALDVHSKMKPQDKMKFQTKISKSYIGLTQCYKEGEIKMAYFDTKTGSLEEAIKAVGGSELEEKLDPVNKTAAKKKFDDRKDKDIDNDGDVDGF